jgi:hypothetical protein
MTGRLRASAWFLAAASLAGAAAAHAQIQSVDTSQPIVIKSSKPASPRAAKFLGQFVSSTPNSITVRDRANSYLLRTFTYGPQAQAHMSQVSAHGGYRYGDKLEIVYAAGSEVALRIKGKPSS